MFFRVRRGGHSTVENIARTAVGEATTGCAADAAAAPADAECADRIGLVAAVAHGQLVGGGVD